VTEAQLQTRALRLSYFTVGYNLVEGLVSVLAGAAAGSVALIGFGFDSFVESLSGGVIIWRFGGQAERTQAQTEQREARALKLIGYTFLVLGAYVLYEAAAKLIRGERPDTAWVGIAVTVASLIVMPLLYWAKRRTAQAMQSRSFQADAKQTLACVFLSAGVLAGLALNAAFGWWQADPLVGLAVAGLLVKEGRETLREGKLCSC
jgi:cation diffusion facilitator family transporter